MSGAASGRVVGSADARYPSSSAARAAGSQPGATGAPVRSIVATA